MNQKVISSRVLGHKSVRWKDMQFIQQDSFKDWSDADKQKLKTSLLSNQFIEPFKVWEASPGEYYCLDGKHRTLMLEELEGEGVQVPEELPAILIDCVDKKEAARFVLLFSSSYAKVTDTGFEEFTAAYDLQIEELATFVNLPEFNFEEIYKGMNKDFSAGNQELDIDEFKDEITMKLIYSREDYLAIKGRIAALMSELNIASPELLIKHLLK